MEAKHTARPWTAKSEGEVVTVVDAEDGSVALVYWTDRRVAEANAQLIAAAPDLLAACKALPTFDLDNAEAFVDAMRLARAAISKAEESA